MWKIDEDVPSPRESQKSIHQLFEKLSVTKTRSSKAPGILGGRNALLGALSDSQFICIVAISESAALIATEKGDVCIVDDSIQRFQKISSADFPVSCITVDAENTYAWVAGKHGSIRYFKSLIKVACYLQL